MAQLDLQAVRPSHVGDQITVTGRVQGYPEAGYVTLVDDNRPPQSVYVDRSKSNVSFPRDEVVTVKGTLDTDLDHDPATQNLHLVVRLDT